MPQNDRPSFNATSPAVPVPANGSSTMPGVASGEISSHPVVTGIRGMYCAPVSWRPFFSLDESGSLFPIVRRQPLPSSYCSASTSLRGRVPSGLTNGGQVMAIGRSEHGRKHAVVPLPGLSHPHVPNVVEIAAVQGRDRRHQVLGEVSDRAYVIPQHLDGDSIGPCIWRFGEMKDGLMTVSVEPVRAWLCHAIAVSRSIIVCLRFYPDHVIPQNEAGLHHLQAKSGRNVAQAAVGRAFVADIDPDAPLRMQGNRFEDINEIGNVTVHFQVPTDLLIGIAVYSFLVIGRRGDHAMHFGKISYQLPSIAL